MCVRTFVCVFPDMFQSVVKRDNVAQFKLKENLPSCVCSYSHCGIPLPRTNIFFYFYVGEWGWGVEGSRLEAWMKSHKSEVAIT